MERTSVHIAERTYALAQNVDLPALRAGMEAAVQAGGLFVDLVVLGNRTVSVLVTPGVMIVLDQETVENDDRDTGDVLSPFDELELL